MRRTVALALVLVALAGCGKDDGSASPTATAGAATSSGQQGNELDRALARYDSPEVMRAVVLADPRFKDFSCPKTSRTDSYGGRFIQCAKPGDGNVFLRLETYGTVDAATKVDDGLTAQGWDVYPGPGAAVAAAGDMQVLKDALQALESRAP